VFQAARARIHKKRFRNLQPQNKQQQQQQQQQSDVDAGQVASSASDGIVHTESPDDAVVNSIGSESPSDRPPAVIGGTKVTLTVVNCDDDDDDDEDRSTVDRGPLQPVIRPTRLALCEPDRPGNGTLSPSESLETPSRSIHLLATSQKSSPTPSLRGSWLDLTKQFIMDRKKCFSPKSKVSD